MALEALETMPNLSQAQNISSMEFERGTEFERGLYKGHRVQPYSLHSHIDKFCQSVRRIKVWFLQCFKMRKLTYISSLT